MGCLFLDLDTDGKEVSGGGVLYLLLTGFFTCVFHSNPSLFLTIIFFSLILQMKRLRSWEIIRCLVNDKVRI